MPKNVLTVGHCSPDHGAISWLLTSNFDVDVAQTHAIDDTITILRRRNFDLVLVNRVLNSDRSQGLHLIKHLKSTEDVSQVPVMMITNYAEQAESAVDLGAVPGFGKSELGNPATVEKLRPYLT